MTKKELIELLKDVPDSMEIAIRQVDDEFGYSLAVAGEVRDIPFSEDPDGPELARDNVFVLTDDI